MKNKSNKPEVIIVIPAYNSENTLEKVFKAIPKNYADNVTIVDDGSKDNTVGVIKSLGIKPIIHEKNLGYGANQKTLYTHALSSGAKYIVMLHPDDQYDGREIPKFIRTLKQDRGDLVLGSRFLSSGLNQTPIYKSLSIRIIAMLFNLVLGTNLIEVNSGYRGYTAKLLGTIPFMKNGNGYLFDPQLIIQTVYFGFKIAEVPVTKRYSKEAISPNFIGSIKHGTENIKLLIEYVLHRLNIRKANFLTT